jgi:hypothetical protein
MKIESSAFQNASFGPEVEKTSTTKPASAPAPLNRVEQAKVEERALAGERGKVEQYLFEKFSAIPPDGALTLELKGKAGAGVEVGGGVKVTAERNAEGDYLVRVQDKAYVGIGHGLSVEGNMQGAATYWVRTPEAAADVVNALVESPRTAVEKGLAYAPDHLMRTEFTTAMDLHGSVHGLGYLGGELSQSVSVALDFDKHQIVTETAISGEFSNRIATLVARTGSEFELAVKLRTETTLPPEVLSRFQKGELSLTDVLRDSKTTHKVIVEGEKHDEVVTLLGGMSRVKKLEAEVDLHALAANPTQPGKALHGEIKVLTSMDAAGGGQDLAGNFHLRSAIYTVTKQDLFHHDDSHQLQSQVDTLRQVAPR